MIPRFCIFLVTIVSSLVLTGPINLCLSMISSQSPSLEVKDLVFRLRIYSLISNIRMICYPLFFHEFISSDRSDINSVLGNSLLLRFEKWVRCWAYNETGPYHSVGGTGLYKLTICRKGSHIPLNCCHGHLPTPELSLLDSFLLT